MLNTTYMVYAHKISKENITWSSGEVALKFKFGYADREFEYTVNSGDSLYNIWIGFCIKAYNITDILDINQFTPDEPKISMCYK